MYSRRLSLSFGVATILSLTTLPMINLEAQIDVGIGPFSLQVFPQRVPVMGQPNVYVHPAMIEHPICYAIQSQKLLEMVVKTSTTEKNERKIVIKRIRVEPYVFGIGKNGQPIIQGNVVAENLIKEVTIKYGEKSDKKGTNDENSDNINENDDEENNYNDYYANAYSGRQGYFSGRFSSTKDKKTVDFQTIADFYVVEDSNFKAPEKIEAQSDIVRIICSIPNTTPAQNQTSDTADTKKNTYSESQLKESEKKYPQDSAASFQDRQLNAKIRDKLSGGLFSKDYDKKIVLKTANGMVLITGTVDKDDDIQKVTDKVKDIEGVKSVDNQLSVKNK